VRSPGEIHVVGVEADGLGGQGTIVHHAQTVGFDHPSQHFLLRAAEVKALFPRLRRQLNGGGEVRGNGIWRESGEVCQVIDMLGDLLVFGVKRQGLGEVGAGDLIMPLLPGFISVLYQFGDAVLACDLQVERVIVVGGIRLRGLGESLLRRVHVPFVHGAYALHIKLFRGPRLPSGG